MLMEGCHEVRGMDVVSWLPGVMCFGVSLPPESILEFLVAPKMPHGYNAFDFPFFFSIDQVRWWFSEVAAMFHRFLVWG